MEEKKPRKKFLRRNWDKYSRLGRGRKKLLKWRRPSGLHNKIRDRRRGYPGRPEVGMRKQVYVEIKVIHSLKELESTKEKEVIISKVGKRKRTEMENKAKQMGIKILNTRK